MKNLTLLIDNDVFDQVHEIATGRRTTVEALVRDYLTGVAREEGRIGEARRDLRNLMANSTARLSPDYRWNREELYEDRMLPRHKHPDLCDDGEP